jgi:hypothetical protein
MHDPGVVARDDAGHLARDRQLELGIATDPHLILLELQRLVALQVSET